MLQNLVRKRVQVKLIDNECVEGELLSLDTGFLEIRCQINGKRKIKYVSTAAIKYVEKI